VLVIDDEADLASVFRKQNGFGTAGVISHQIDRLRDLVKNSAFLQVTATPYALYLQPDDEVVVNGTSRQTNASRFHGSPADPQQVCRRRRLF
jgi:hypothetical protein